METIQFVTEEAVYEDLRKDFGQEVLKRSVFRHGHSIGVDGYDDSESA